MVDAWNFMLRDRRVGVNYKWVRFGIATAIREHKNWNQFARQMCKGVGACSGRKGILMSRQWEKMKEMKKMSVHIDNYIR